LISAAYSGLIARRFCFLRRQRRAGVLGHALHEHVVRAEFEEERLDAGLQSAGQAAHGHHGGDAYDDAQNR
jgi:predicted transcriptional regulator